MEAFKQDAHYFVPVRTIVHNGILSWELEVRAHAFDRAIDDFDQRVTYTVCSFIAPERASREQIVQQYHDIIDARATQTED